MFFFAIYDGNQLLHICGCHFRWFYLLKAQGSFERKVFFFAPLIDFRHKLQKKKQCTYRDGYDGIFSIHRIDSFEKILSFVQKINFFRRVRCFLHNEPKANGSITQVKKKNLNFTCWTIYIQKSIFDR